MLQIDHNKLGILLKYLKFTSRVLLIAFSGLMGIAIIAAVALAIRLSYGSIDLNFIKTKLEQSLSTEHLGSNFESLTLMWDNQRHRLFVKAKNFKVIEHCNKEIASTFPEVGLNFHLTDLLSNRLIPSDVIILKPYLAIYKHPNGQYSIKSHLHPDDSTSLDDFDLHDFEDLFKSVKSLEVSEGSFDVIDLKNNKTVNIPDANLRLVRNGNTFFLETNASLPLFNLQIKAQADLQPSFSNFKTSQIKMDIKTGGFAYDELHTLWPEKLIPPVRQWLVKNLSAGQVTATNTSISFKSDFINDDETEYSLDDISGAIHFKGMTIDYLTGMPKIGKVDGVANFNKKMFDIDILSGISNNIKITKGKIKIFGLGVPDQTIEITTDQEGNLKDALQIIDAEPLTILKDADIKLDVKSGTAKTKLFLAFPLEFKLKPEDFVYKVDADIKNLSIHNVLDTKQYKINTANGNLSLKVNNQKINIDGKGKIHDSPATVSLEHFIKPDPKSKYKSHYVIKTNLNDKSINKFGLPSFMNGSTVLNIDYTKVNDETSTLHVESDMTKAQFKIPGLLELKREDVKCQGVADFVLQNNIIKQINTLKVSGDHIKMNFSAQVSKDGQSLDKLTCPDLRLGNTYIDFSMQKASGHGFKINIQGPSLDLEPLFDYKSDEPRLKNEPPINIALNCETVFLGENKIVKNLKGNVATHNSNITKASLSANIAGKKKGQTSNVSLNVHTTGNTSKLTVNSNNGGEVLRLLNMYDSAKGGKLLIHADKIRDEPWIGKLQIGNFRVEDSSVITRLISTGFGLFDGLHNSVKFDKFITKFKFDSDSIQLKDGKASGASIGLSLAGSIDRRTDTVKLHGAVLPYNIINMVLLKIPVVGHLMGGETGGIWGVSYSIAGPISKPVTSINPLSALTPGFLRNIFNPEDEYGEDLQSDNDYEEDNKEE